MLRGPEVSSQAWRNGGGGGEGWRAAVGGLLHEYAWEPGILQPLSSAFQAHTHTHTKKRQQSASWTSTSLLHLHSSSSSGDGGGVAAAIAGASQQRLRTPGALFVFARSCHIQPVSTGPGEIHTELPVRGETSAGAGDTLPDGLIFGRIFCLDECRGVKSCQSKKKKYI